MPYRYIYYIKLNMYIKRINDKKLHAGINLKAAVTVF